MWRDGVVEVREKSRYPISTDDWVEKKESFVLQSVQGMEKEEL